MNDSNEYLADGLHDAHSMRWRELVFALLPLASVQLIGLMGWEINIPDPLYVPIVMMFPIYLLLLLLVSYRQAANR